MVGNPDRQPPWIEPVEGTLVMADVSGFTAMSERLAASGKEGAETLTNVINRFFTQMLDIAYDYDGVTLKFGGDAMLIIFCGNEHAKRAVAAGLRMLQATTAHAPFKVGTGRVKLGMSMGARSGTFYTASVGDPQLRMQELILGEGTCETCAAEAIATSGELCVTRGTLDALDVVAKAQPRGDVWRVDSVSHVAVTGYTPVPDISAALGRALLPHLPPPIARVITTGTGSSDIEGEHRRVTIVFVNVRGTEELLAEHGPHVLLDEVQRYTENLARLADRYGGFLVSNDVYDHGFKYIVVFGAPVAHEWDTANALRMVCELQKGLARGCSPLEHRIGVNAGFVFAGDVGPPYRRQYTVMGDAVNLSARLMSAAKAGEVLLPSPVAEEAGPGFSTVELPPITVKGKSSAIEICRLVGECAVADVGLTDAGQLVGRECELAEMDAAIAGAFRGHGRLVVLSGEPGIGKSRLMAEAEAHLRAADWQIVRGVCYSHTAATPYGPWMQLLPTLLGVCGDDPGPARVAALEAALEGLGADQRASGPLLAPLLNVPAEADPFLEGLDDETRRRLLFDLVAAIVRSRAAAAPLGILLEDLHFADSSSRQLLAHVASRVGDARTLLVVTRRPSGDALTDVDEDLVIRIDLGELDSSAATQLVEGALAACELPPRVIQRLLAKAKGNPLFLEQLAASLSRPEVLERIRGIPSDRLDGQLDAIGIPDRVQGLIMSRIDQLGPAEREALRVAAVIGNEFDSSTLGVLIDDQPAAALETALANLDRIELTARSSHGRRVFSHGLIREVAYDSLLFARRRQLHHRLAVHIESANVASLESVVEELAHHFALSRDDPKTRVYAVQAAEKARRVFAHDEAIQFLHSALGATRSRDAQAACVRSYLVEAIGDAYERSGRHEEAVQNYRDALNRWRRSRFCDQSAPAALGLRQEYEAAAREASLCQKVGWSYYRMHHAYGTSLRWFARGLKALPRGQGGLRARLLESQGRAYYRMGELEQTAELARRALHVARAAGAERSQAWALHILAHAYFRSGDLARSLNADKEVLRLYQSVGDVPGQALAHGSLVCDYAEMGQLTEALEHQKAALAIFERTGDPLELGIELGNAGELMRLQGDLDAAFAYCTRALDVLADSGAETIIGRTLLTLSEVQLQAGEAHAALESIEAGIRRLEDTGAHLDLIEARVHLAFVRLAVGDAKSAREIAEHQIDEAHANRMRVDESAAHRAAGLAITAYDPALAEQHLREAARLANEARADYELGLALLALARLHVEMGSGVQLRSARNELARAERVLQTVGADGLLKEIAALRDGLPGTRNG